MASPVDAQASGNLPAACRIPMYEIYLDDKRSDEVDQLRLRPHSYEFFLYYDTPLISNSRMRSSSEITSGGVRVWPFSKYLLSNGQCLQYATTHQ